MTKLVAIASKQVQLHELVACVRHFEVTDFRLHVFVNQGRMDLDGVRLLIRELCPQSRFEVSSFDIDDRATIARILARKADIVALPLYRASAFYRQVPALRRRSTIVHVTDGLGDLFTMWELQRAVIARTPMALAKGALVIPQLYLCRADLEFSLFHPKTSPYARKSLGVGPFPMTAAKRRRLTNLVRAHGPQALVIDGFDLTAERIAAGVRVDSYIATRRDGGIVVSGRLHLEDEVICAEEVLEVMRPAVVIGCPSTALAAARCLHADIPVFCITTAEAVKIRGPLFNKVFRRHASLFGITFASTASDADAVDVQLDLVRAAMPPAIRACA